MRALALEHLGPNPVGVYGDVLAERGIDVQRVLLHEGEALPDWRDYDVIVVMGAGASVWEEADHPWIAGEKRLVREAVLAGVPYFGVCYGAQLLAAVFGGRGYRGIEPELGVSQIFLTAAAARDPVFRGFPPDLEVCEWHSNHFDLPPGAVRLARSPRYENQAIRIGRVAYGIQCHLETSLDDLREWLELFPDTIPTFRQRHGADSLDGFLDDYAAFVPELLVTARQLFGRWLAQAQAVGSLASTARALAGAGGRPVASALVGREAERARIDAALSAARQGGGAAIVLRGEPGAGKTALLDDAAVRAGGLRVLRTAGAHTGPERPFAGLAALCAPLLDRHLAALPEPRRAALSGALGLGGTPAGLDRFAVYSAALHLLAAAAEEVPLLVAVDDAHLLDDASAEAIPFIARRLRSDGIALLIATEADDGLPDAEELRLGPLDAAEARALLAAQPGAPLAPEVTEAVALAAGGNPLALIELTRDLGPEERAGTAPLTLPPSAEWVFLRRIERLPAETRQALLVAALADGGDAALVARACAALGLGLGALAPAESAAVAGRAGERVTFRHEVARIAVSYSALRAERRAVHAALAGALGGEAALWHRARAATEPDAAIAGGLETVAAAALERGAYGTAARALEQSARLSEGGDARAARLLRAAECERLAGHLHAALDHLAMALACVGDDGLRVEIEHLHGRIAARSGAAGTACDRLAAAAERCAGSDPARAAALLADAVMPALRAGSPAAASRLAHRSVALAERASGGEAGFEPTLMLGVALLFAGEHAHGVATVERADALAEAHQAGRSPRGRAHLGAALAIAGRHVRARDVLSAVVAEARGSGAADMLPYALVRLAGVDLDTGRWRAAAVALHDALGLAVETGNGADHGMALGTLAWLEAARGEDGSCRAHVEEALELAARLGGGARLDRASTALALLDLGAGRPEAAIGPLEEVLAFRREHGWSDAALVPHQSPDLVEAYVAVGRGDEALALAGTFAAEAERTGRPSALALAARCRMLVAGDGAFDSAFAAALGAGVDVTGPFEQARTRLSCGLRLAEAGRVDDAAEALTPALLAFDRLGAVPWAARARGGLASLGIAPPPATPSRLERLTLLELEVAAAAADGADPQEVAARLFLGPRSARLFLVSALAKLGAETPADLAALLEPSGLARPARTVRTLAGSAAGPGAAG